MRKQLSILALTAVAAAQEYTCDWENDSCPWTMSGECDYWFGCPEDCYDCDPMQLYRYNCTGCVENGGYWCPGDALCLSTPVTAETFANFINFEGNSMITACPTEADWKQTCEPLTADNVFSDPMYDAMAWEFQLINVEEVWRQGFTGKGIHVRVTDDGVDGDHPEFVNRFDVENSCPNYLRAAHENHGTACASLIGAEADNGICSVGIAPGVTLSACSDALYDFTVENRAKLLLYKIEVVDVSSNSWGPVACSPLPIMDDDDGGAFWDDDDSIGGDPFAFDDDDGGWDDDGDSSANPFETDNGGRRRKRRLRPGRRLQCMFNYTHENSPCNVCGDVMELSDEACKQSIIDHCSNFYDLDETSCVEYLDLFVDCEYHTLELPFQEAFNRAITEGRDGKGVVFVFAAGNDKNYGTDANTDGLINSRLTISVGAVDKNGKKTGYSTPGAPVFVTAPGGDDEFLSNQIVAGHGGDCLDAGTGTSYAAPTVAGVVALMLEANGNLTWRDVQGVLASTAQFNDPDEPTWITNAAGFHHSYYHGFGLVDAAAAVSTAQSWTLWGPEQQILAESGVLDLPITDDPEQTTASTILVTDDDKNLVTESVVVYVDIEHGSRGDLTIRLISPSGTESILAPGKRPEDTQLEGQMHWKLMTVRNWGESPYGNWTLEIVDEEEGVLSDCLDIPFAYKGLGDGDTDDVFGNDDGDDFLHDNGENRTRRLDYENEIWKTFDWDCNYILSDDLCSKGNITNPVANEIYTINEDGTNLTAAEACCACGGGTVASSIQHLLNSWRIVVYGHEGLASDAIDTEVARNNDAV